MKAKNIAAVLLLVSLIGLAVYNGFKSSEQDNDNDSYMSAEEYMEAVTLDIGTSAPNAQVVDIRTDKQVKLSDYNEKPVILAFFASWCDICKENVPLYNEMAEKYKEDVTVLYINYTQTERSIDDVRTYLKNMTIEAPVLIDAASSAIGKYKVISLPTTYFITKDGKIEDKSFGIYSKKDFEERVKALISTGA